MKKLLIGTLLDVALLVVCSSIYFKYSPENRELLLIIGIILGIMVALVLKIIFEEHMRPWKQVEIHPQAPRLKKSYTEIWGRLSCEYPHKVNLKCFEIKDGKIHVEYKTLSIDRFLKHFKFK